MAPPSSLPDDYSGLELDFHTLANHIPQLAWMSRPDGAIFWINQQWLNYSGRSLEQMHGWNWISHIRGDFRARVTSEYKDHLTEGEPWEDTIPLERYDGEYRWFLARVVAVRDNDGKVLRWFGTATDITEQRKISERQTRLMREVDHRAQNALAVAQAIVKLSRADTIDDYRATVEHRIAALSRAHTMLADRRWHGLDLRTIINGELAARRTTTGKVALSGEVVWIDPSFVQSVALLFNELVSNAERYGALSLATGHLAVAWKVTDKDIHISWRETGVTDVKPPQKTGFGISVIERIIRQQLNRRITREWAPDGLSYDFTLPRHAAHRCEQPCQSIPIVRSSS